MRGVQSSCQNLNVFFVCAEVVAIPAHLQSTGLQLLRINYFCRTLGIIEGVRDLVDQVG